MKSLSKFMCVSKSWLQLISSPAFVKNHIKLTTNDKGYIYHKLLFRNTNENFKFCSLPPLFTKQQLIEELFHIDSPLERFTSSIHIVGFVNGLICVFNGKRNAYRCNTKSKELPKFTNNLWSDAIRCGFGYDESRDDYKVVLINYCCNHYSSYIMTIVVNIYSLRTNSWTTLHDQLQCFLVNHYGRFVNGKLYWTLSTCINKYKVCNITSFDLADGTWGSLELPICGKDNFDINLGVVGSDLSLLYTCQRGAATSDVWIMKHSGVDVSWTKLFTIKYPQNIKTHRCFAPPFTFSIHFRHGEILLLLPSAIMIYDGSTRQLKHTAHVKQCEEIYVESLVNPLTISDQGRRNQETPQSSHS